MNDIEIKNSVTENLREIKTVTYYELDEKMHQKNYILFKKIEPSSNFFKTFMLLRNIKTNEIKHVTSRKMFVQYGKWVNYPEAEWMEVLRYKDYTGKRERLFTWAAYVVPKNAKIGERFYIEDIIGDIKAEEFWGSVFRAKDGVGVWDGKDLDIDESLYDRVFLIG